MVSSRRHTAPRLAIAVALLLSLGGCAASPAGGAPRAPATSELTATPAKSSPAASSASPAVVATSAAPTASRQRGTPEHPDCGQLKCIAITYDDGPSAVTNQLLDYYVAAGAKATFFVNGPAVRARPEVVKRAYKLGFEIGNHTTNHKELRKLDDATIAQEIQVTSNDIKWAIGVKPTLLRPPFGRTNERVDKVAGQQQLPVIEWTSTPTDWLNRDVGTVARLTLEDARPGAIVLMHDTHQWTLDATPAIIKGLQDQGYTLVTVSQLLGVPPVAGKQYPYPFGSTITPRTNKPVS